MEEQVKSTSTRGQEATPPSSSPMIQKRKILEDHASNQDLGSPYGDAKTAPEKERRRMPTTASSALLAKRKSPCGLSLEDDNIRNKYDDDKDPESQSSDVPSSDSLRKRLRHKSMPASATRRAVLQEVSANVMPLTLSNRVLEQFRHVVVDVFKEQFHEYRTQAAPMPLQDRTTALAQAQQAVEPSEAAGRGHSATSKARAQQPRLTHHVPNNERLTDRELIELGRNAAPYDRHVTANYAFKVRGGLTAKYKYLLDFPGVDGTPAWNASEAFRIIQA